MRLLLSLIFIYILSISCINSKKQELFLNFIPYSKKDCIGKPDGDIGYSSIVNTCISIDKDITNHLFKISNDFNQVEIFKTNKQCNSLNGDNGKLPKPIIKSKLGECISSKELGLIDNSKEISPSSLSYYKLTSSFKPFILPNSFVNSFMSTECKSDASNSIFVEYFTNSHSMSSNGGNRYFCNNENVPFIQQCFDKDLNICSNPIDMSTVKCDSIISFTSNSTLKYSILKKEHTSESSSSSGESGGSTGFSHHASASSSGGPGSTGDGNVSTGSAGSTGFSDHASSTGPHNDDGVDENTSTSGSSGEALYIGGIGDKISQSYKTVYCSPK